MTQPAENHDASQRLLRSLTRELFQTETSAAWHCQREAERLDGTPPAEVLRAVAAHAERVRSALPKLASSEELPVSKLGTAVGAFFSQTRDKVLDRVIQVERSYRGTLLGVRHGLDLVSMIRHVAARSEHPRLTEFCEEWLATRSALVDRLEDQLAWFADEPERAMQLAGTLIAARRHAA
jgi:hypothetical protein